MIGQFHSREESAETIRAVEREIHHRPSVTAKLHRSRHCSSDVHECSRQVPATPPGRGIHVGFARTYCGKQLVDAQLLEFAQE
jgi:hypothetical protein